MSRRAASTSASRWRGWLLPLPATSLAVTAVVLDLPVWAQAAFLAAAAGTAAARLHLGGQPPSVIERDRPQVDLPVEEQTAGALRQRPVARRALLVAGAASVAAGTWAVRWIGPRPAAGTAWADGLRLVTNDGDPLRPEDVPEGGVVTVWPEGSIDVELTATMLLRLREPPTEPTRIDHVVDRTLVAYSRICTHAGCPVAMYRDRDHALFCPCHQATFDAVAGAQPVFGPASRPLPQLPLGVDRDGFLVARGDFPTLPGPPGGGP